MSHTRQFEDYYLESILKLFPYAQEKTAVLQTKYNHLHYKGLNPEAKTQVYTMSNLQSLLDKLLFDDYELLGVPNKELQFVLTMQEELKFGRFGMPRHNNLIAAHSQYVENGRCLIAGKVILNEAGEIILLSNKSGDFLSDYSAIFHALLAFKKAGVGFASEVKFVLCDGSAADRAGNAPEMSVLFSAEVLQKWFVIMEELSLRYPPVPYQEKTFSKLENCPNHYMWSCLHPNALRIEPVNESKFQVSKSHNTLFGCVSDCTPEQRSLELEYLERKEDFARQVQLVSSHPKLKHFVAKEYK